MSKFNQGQIVVGKASDNKVLSATQKEFNRLTKAITEHREKIQQIKALAERMNIRAASEMRPLVDRHHQLNAELVRLFDRMFTKHKFNKTESKKLRHLITSRSFDLVQEGFEEFKALYNRYEPDEDFDTIASESEALTAEIMKEMAGMMFGVEFDEDADVSTPEKMQAYLSEKMAQQEAEAEEKKQHRTGRQSKKPKTAKQIEAEAKRAARHEKQQQEEKKITQTVREVYMDLVKAFHPDREPDEAEKARKTAILQRVTAAYEDNDLLALLQLQLELERMDGEHLNTLADDKLRYFNKNLRRQVHDLQMELHEHEFAIGAMAGLGPFAPVYPKNIEMKFEKDLKSFKAENKQLQEEIEALRDPVVLKAWLKYYEIPEEPDDLGEMLGQIFR